MLQLFDWKHMDTSYRVNRYGVLCIKRAIETQTVFRRLSCLCIYGIPYAYMHLTKIHKLTIVPKSRAVSWRHRIASHHTIIKISIDRCPELPDQGIPERLRTGPYYPSPRKKECQLSIVVGAISAAHSHQFCRDRPVITAESRGSRQEVHERKLNK